MNKYAYISYTRTKYVDFRFLYGSEKIDERPLLKELIENLVGRPPQGNTPQWVFIKKDNYMLYGLVCENNVLNDICTDEYGRLIRGFFGILISAPSQKDDIRAIDINSFKILYQEYIVPKWETSSFNSDSLEVEESVFKPSNTEITDFGKAFEFDLASRQFISSDQNFYTAILHAMASTSDEIVISYLTENVETITLICQKLISGSKMGAPSKDQQDQIDKEIFCESCGNLLNEYGKCEICEPKNKKEKSFLYKVSITISTLFIIILLWILF